MRLALPVSRGEHGLLGIKVEVGNQVIGVATPQKDGPREGDVVLGVDGFLLEGAPLSEAFALLPRRPTHQLLVARVAASGSNLQCV